MPNQLIEEDVELRTVQKRNEYKHPVTGKKFGEFTPCVDGNGNIRDVNEPRNENGFLIGFVKRKPVLSLKFVCPPDIDPFIYEKSLEEVKKSHSYRHPISGKCLSELEDIVVDSEGNLRERNEKNIGMSLSSGNPVNVMDSPDMVEIQNNMRSKEHRNACLIARTKMLNDKIKQSEEKTKQKDEAINIRFEKIMAKMEIQEIEKKSRELEEIKEKLKSNTVNVIENTADVTKINEIEEKIEMLKEEIKFEKTISEDLRRMFNELLKIIEEFFNNYDVQNRDNSVNILMEEEKVEPRKLGFF